MSVPDRLKSLVGEWAGRNRLWLSPQDRVRESGATGADALAVEAVYARVR